MNNPTKEEILREFENLLTKAAVRGGYDPNEIDWLSRSIDALLSAQQAEREKEIEKLTTLKEFLAATPAWHKHVKNMFRQCPACGSKPENIEKLHQELSSHLSKPHDQ
jgi:hypothetical protein